MLIRRLNGWSFLILALKLALNERCLIARNSGHFAVLTPEINHLLPMNL
jgi:hypothetical protein